MSVINNINDTSYVPIMMECVDDDLPESLPHLEDCTFITKLRVVCKANQGTDPLSGIDFTPPPTNHPCGPMPTTGCFILTLIGKWYDILNWHYSALQYKFSHIHDNDKNDQATIDALQEMGRHINACFTHPIAQEMINTTNGDLSSSTTNTITFGLVINADNNTTNNNDDDDSGKITYIDPSDPPTQQSADNTSTSYRNTPSIGWLCLFVMYSHNFYYHLPIVDLSLHTEFMKTYNPDDLPPTEAFAYRALIDKWKNEKCVKELSDFMPKPNQLNPYTYLEAWCDNIKQFHDLQEKQKQKEQEEAKIKARVQDCFEEYKRLYLQQQTVDVKSHIQQQQMNQHYNSNNNHTDNIDPSLIATLSSTLYNEYYAKYLSDQLNDLKIMNHLQSHQYQQLSDAKLRYPLHHGYIHNTPRKHIALPFPSSSSPTSTSSSSQIDTLIALATTTHPIPTTSTPASLFNGNDNIMNQQYNQEQNHQQQQSLAILHHQYNVLDEKKHILTIQYDELSTLLQSTIDNKDGEIQTLKQQISQMEKEMITLQEQIKILQQQITTSHDELIATKEQYEDELTTIKEQYENEITILKEECHRKELNAMKEAMASAYINKDGMNTSNTTNTPHNIIPPHINNQISFLQQQLQSKDQQIKDIIQSKDQQLEAKNIQHQQQLEAKDQQLQSKDQQIALLMQMLAEANKK